MTATLVAGGCGSSFSFDGGFFGQSSDEQYLAAGEDLIAGELAQRIALGPLEATCSGKDLGAGDTFDCTAVSGVVSPILFVGTIEENGQEILITSTNLLLAEQVEEVEAFAAGLIENQTGEVITAEDFECADGTVVIAVGEQLDCRVTVPPDGTVYAAPVTIDSLEDLSITVNVGEPVG